MELNKKIVFQIFATTRDQNVFAFMGPLLICLCLLCTCYCNPEIDAMLYPPLVT